jgi:drug/metabolite transporter (DMT)-like permease
VPKPLEPESDAGARLMLVALSFTWGVTWPINRIALGEVPPFSMRVATCFLGALVLFAAVRLQHRSIGIPAGRTRLHVAVAGCLNIAGFTVLSSIGQLGSTTSRVIILAYTMPIWACLMAMPILGERLDRIRVVALVLCVGGIAVLISPLVAAGVPSGLLFALAAGVSWAAGTIYLKWARIAADPIATAAWQLVAALVVTAATVPLFEGGFYFRPIELGTLVALLFSGTVGSGLAYFLWFAAVQRLPATIASLGTLSVPVIGIAASALVLGERPTAADYVGCALILAAAACVLLVPSAPSSQTSSIGP